MFKICIIHGPNLNLLGQREPKIYGEMTFAELNRQLIAYGGEEKGLKVEIFQSNHEGDLVDKIQSAADFDYLIINAAAYTILVLPHEMPSLACSTPAVESSFK